MYVCMYVCYHTLTLDQVLSVARRKHHNQRIKRAQSIFCQCTGDFVTLYGSWGTETKYLTLFGLYAFGKGSMLKSKRLNHGKYKVFTLSTPNDHWDNDGQQSFEQIFEMPLSFLHSRNHKYEFHPFGHFVVAFDFYTSFEKKLCEFVYSNFMAFNLSTPE